MKKSASSSAMSLLFKQFFAFLKQCLSIATPIFLYLHQVLIGHHFGCMFEILNAVAEFINLREVLFHLIADLKALIFDAINTCFAVLSVQ